MNYEKIYEHYENCLEEFGDSPKGHDWPDMDSTNTRYEVMTDIFCDENTTCSVLDLGCGTGMYLEYLINNEINVSYEGADISDKFINIASEKFKDNNFYNINVLEETLPKKYDYIIVNGVFTMSVGLSNDEMFDFLTKFIDRVWPNTKKGLAINFMSKNVDWERDDLYHMSIDKLTKFLFEKKITKEWVVRNDYGLYEYTIYLKK